MATALELRNEAQEALTKAIAARDGGKGEEFKGFWAEYVEKDKLAKEAHEEEAAIKAATEKYDWKPSEVRNPDDAAIKTQNASDATKGVQLADGKVVPFADESTEGWIKGYPVSVQHPAIIRRLTPELAMKAHAENTAFSKWFRYGMSGLSEAERKVMAGLKDREEKTLTEGTGSAGGFLVPTDQRRDVIIESGVLGGVVRPIATRFQTTRDGGTFPASNDATTWAAVAEEAAFAESNPTLSEVAFTIRKFGRLNRVSVELLEDSAVDVPALLGLLLGRSLGRFEDQQSIEGDGTTEPLGLRTTGAAQGNIADITDLFTLAAPTMVEISAAFYELPAQWRANATWFMTSGFMGTLATIASTSAGIHVFQELMASEPNPRLLGRPIVFFDGTGWDAGTLALTANNEVGAIGDFNYYYFVDRVGLSVTRLDERYADTDQVGFRFKVRYDSFFAANDPFRILKAAAS